MWPRRLRVSSGALEGQDSGLVSWHAYTPWHPKNCECQVEKRLRDALSAEGRCVNFDCATKMVYPRDKGCGHYCAKCWMEKLGDTALDGIIRATNE